MSVYNQILYNIIQNICILYWAKVLKLCSNVINIKICTATAYVMYNVNDNNNSLYIYIHTIQDLDIYITYCEQMIFRVFLFLQVYNCNITLGYQGSGINIASLLITFIFGVISALYVIQITFGVTEFRHHIITIEFDKILKL